MNGNLSKHVCVALLATFGTTAACGGDDDGKALRNPLSPSAAGGGSVMADASMSGAQAQSARYPMGVNGFTAPGGIAMGEQSQCVAPATGQHWTQIAGRPRDGGVGIIRNRAEATFRGTDTLTRTGVCELARQHLGNSGPWCGTVGHTADWEATYAMLDQLESCRGSSVQVDPPQPQQQQGFTAITGWSCGEPPADNNRDAGPMRVVPTTGSGTGWDILVPENGGPWNPQNCHSLPGDIGGTALSTPYSFTDPDSSKVWVKVALRDGGDRPIGLTYNPAIGHITSGANDNIYTGNRETGYLTFRGERWRVVIVEDEQPISALNFNCGNDFTITSPRRGFKEITIKERDGTATYPTCAAGVPVASASKVARFDIDGTKALDVRMSSRAGIAFDYNPAINDNALTGNRYSEYEAIEGEQWRVVIVDDELPVPLMKDWPTASNCFAPPSNRDAGSMMMEVHPNGYRDIIIPENGGPWGAAHCKSGGTNTVAWGNFGNVFPIDGWTKDNPPVKVAGQDSLAVDWHPGDRRLAFNYNKRMDDDVYTGNRYSRYRRLHDDVYYRVVIVEDETPTSGTAYMHAVVDGSEHTGGATQNLVSMDEGENFANLRIRAFREGAGPFCFDLTDMDDYRIAIDGADRNGCIQIPAPSGGTTQGSRTVRVYGSHIDDGIVSRRNPTNPDVIAIDHTTGGTTTGTIANAQTVRFQITDDDMVRIRPTHAEAGKLTFTLDTYGATDSTRYQLAVELQGSAVKNSHNQRAVNGFMYSAVWTNQNPAKARATQTWTVTADSSANHTLSLDCSDGNRATARFVINNHGGLGAAAFDIVNPVVHLCR